MRHGSVRSRMSNVFSVLGFVADNAPNKEKFQSDEGHIRELF